MTERVRIARRAVEDIAYMKRKLELPDDTMERLQATLEPLGRFPELGPALVGRWKGYRVLIGPWRWMLVVYRIDGDGVTVLTIQDARRAVTIKANNTLPDAREPSREP